MQSEIHWRRKERRVFLCVLISVFILAPASLCAQTERQRVLLLHSYHQGLSWTDNIVEGIHSIFEKSPLPLDIQIEYMDTKRVFSERYLRQLYELYQTKYGIHPPEAIISSDDNAFNFLRRYRDDLFPGTPVVFCGVNYFKDAFLDGLEHCTGVNEEPDMRATLELALKLHPATTQVTAIIESTTTGQKYYDKLLELIPLFQDQVSFLILKDIGMSAILRTVRHLPSNSIVLYTPFSQDGRGKFFTFKESAERIAKASLVPVYGLHRFSLGHGIVGGMLINGVAQGKAAASMALQILAGKPVAQIPVLRKSPNQYMFDYVQLKRFNLSPSHVPEHSLIIHRPITWYEQHKTWFWSLIILCTIILVLAAIVQLRTAALQNVNRYLQQEIFDREQVEQKLQKAKENAEIANRAKSEFLSNMSHEFRTPLNGILGYTQILQQRPGLLPAQEEGLRIIEESGRHLLTLISDILDLSKIEAKKMRLYPQDVNVSTFLEGILGIISIRAHQKDIQFKANIQSGLPVEVKTDAKRLRQVLLNVLSNAVKFTDTGQVTFNVFTIPSKENAISAGDSSSATIRFEVIDTGIGISPEQQTKIFLPFEQVSDSFHQTIGTGLGLAISQQIIQLMGSQIRTCSVPGQGSTFWFDLSLPVLRESSGSLPIQTRRICGYTGRRCKALVVDDKSSNRSVLINLLAPLGFECFEAVDGLEAVQKACQMRPDIILTDLVMPVMSGEEAVRAIRNYPELEESVIIAVSANVLDSEQEKSKRVGCDAFLPKPVQAEALFNLLCEFLPISWEYSRDSSPQAERKGGVSKYETGPEKMLIPPPEEELEALFELAMLGKMRQLREKAVQLEQINQRFQPFANKLYSLAQNYQEKAIVGFIKQYRHPGGNV